MGRSLVVVIGFLVSSFAFGHGGSGTNFVHIKAKDKYERTKIVNMGVSIEALASDSVYGMVSDELLAKVKASDLELVETFTVKDPAKGLDFPREDARFHNYAEMTKALDDLAANNPKIMKKFSIGKTIQGRDIWAIQVNSSESVLKSAPGAAISAKPGIVFMGNHHAREHLSAEIPLMLLEHLAKNFGADRDITDLLDKRDVYVIPMVNPDGVEYDIQTGSYKWQRKNMRPNGTSKIGVDLNRNYGHMWNKGGSSSDPSSDIYHGPNAFSEPETQAIKAFVEARPNLKILLSFHTFSELILYPWGHKYDGIEKKQDKDAHIAMARKMAEWNKYTPQQSSELYIASGDTTDWSYGALGIFSFTFELSPKDLWQGGFYPGAGVIDRVFQDNLKPALYLIDLADDPYRALNARDDRLSWLM
jgi:carboxypeptidase T